MYKRYAVGDCLLRRGVADVPYLQEGGDTANSQYAAAGPRLVVEPGKILELKRRLADRRGKIDAFIEGTYEALTVVAAPGADPRSDEIVKILSTNGEMAIVAAKGFVAELGLVIEQLDRIAQDYRLVEESNSGTLSGPR